MTLRSALAVLILLALRCANLIVSVCNFTFLTNFDHQIGDYLLTLPQQLEPYITQENPGLEAAMKAGNLPFPDLQGMDVRAEDMWPNCELLSFSVEEQGWCSSERG